MASVFGCEAPLRSVASAHIVRKCANKTAEKGPNCPLSDPNVCCGGRYTAICPRPRPLPSPWDMCVVFLVVLKWFSLLVLAVQDKKPTFITCAGTLQWGVSVQAFGPVAP